MEWYLVANYLKLRRSVFVDEKGWGLPTFNQQEFEEYDGGPLPHYVIAHEGGDVVAGARLLPCNVEFRTIDGPRSYMIRDAALGRIKISKDIWADGDPPTDDRTWELTRLVSISKDRRVTRDLVHIAQDYIAKLGARHCLFLCPPSVFRLAQRYGFGPVACGPVIETPTETYQSFRCRVQPVPTVA